ncbi:ABATE domain-containing protein [Streptomyces sp. Wb2n-11]|uniref:CGNR zinc finger domain-containing protein n=1 Tax=Streptomyces sp. Wb2n-11 TaxID=1030533 RepID=UPI000A3DB23F|nr:CGNR zinc finger domain-containing protein [Streptomyces sp. Wb2n-11]
MAAHTGARESRFVSGRVCLDLVATGPDPTEQLSHPGRLREWLVGTRLVPHDVPLEAVDDAWLHDFTEVRTHIGELVRAELEGSPAPRALDRVNALAAAPPPGVRAVRTPDGAWARALTGDAPERAALLAAVARDAVDLLTDPVARARLRACEGGGCRRLYLDTSRGRRRRWCSSEVCGNRERVARHRRRALAATRAESFPGSR